MSDISAAQIENGTGIENDFYKVDAEIYRQLGKNITQSFGDREVIVVYLANILAKYDPISLCKFITYFKHRVELDGRYLIPFSEMENGYINDTHVDLFNYKVYIVTARGKTPWRGKGNPRADFIRERLLSGSSLFEEF